MEASTRESPGPASEVAAPEAARRWSHSSPSAPTGGSLASTASVGCCCCSDSPPGSGLTAESAAEAAASRASIPAAPSSPLARGCRTSSTPAADFFAASFRGSRSAAFFEEVRTWSCVGVKTMMVSVVRVFVFFGFGRERESARERFFEGDDVSEKKKKP